MDKLWKGGDGSTEDQNGDVNRVGNWMTRSGGAVAAIPGSSDRAIFNKQATIVPTTFSDSKHTVGTHYNCFGSPTYGPDDCQGVEVEPGFTGLVGATAAGVITPIEFSLAAAKQLIYRGNKAAYFKVAGGSGKKAPEIIVDCDAALNSGLLTLSSETDGGSAEEVTDINFKGAGTLVLSDDMFVKNIYNEGTGTITIGKRMFAPTAAAKTLTASAASDQGGGVVRIPVVHGGDYTAGKYVKLIGTTYFSGVHRVVNMPDNNNIDIRHPFTAETFAVTDTAVECDLVNIYANSGTIGTNSPADALHIFGATVNFGIDAAKAADVIIDCLDPIVRAGTLNWRAAGLFAALEQRGGSISVVGNGDKVLGIDSAIIRLLGGTFDASLQTGKFTQGGSSTPAEILCQGCFPKFPLGFQIAEWSEQLG